jgi:PPOX class probable F420-dependent enzyme
MRLHPDAARDRFADAPVARLATADAAGVPHLVPVTFAVRDDTVFFAVDHKPKSSTDLRRLRNIAANPCVTLLVDHYADDWSALWWARADGRAEVWEAGGERQRAVALLRAKYRQYRDRPPTGPAVAVQVDRWSGWAYRDDASPV